MSRPPSLSLSTGDGDFGRPMELEASSESLDLASSFTLTSSGTFAKEDFVINKSGIAAINHTEVRRTGLQLQDLDFFEVLGKGASSLVRRAVHKPSQAQLAVKIINVFDKGKRDQLLRELRTLYSSQNFPWLVAFHDCLYDEGAIAVARHETIPAGAPGIAWAYCLDVRLANGTSFPYLSLIHISEPTRPY